MVVEDRCDRTNRTHAETLMLARMLRRFARVFLVSVRLSMCVRASISVLAKRHDTSVVHTFIIDALSLVHAVQSDVPILYCLRENYHAYMRIWLIIWIYI